jgi:hypothetical protein
MRRYLDDIESSVICLSITTAAAVSDDSDATLGSILVKPDLTAMASLRAPTVILQLNQLQLGRPYRHGLDCER